ncbi:MAG: RlmE family RNA methyltransferase [Albimonas sp.]|uniref:RlmE family RNA methyltransferase n=1 Tax=Albimonas sp. TaxID=1872425 RepID=UPI004056AA7C|tara:strand:+ start:621 stop:1409 length:789 start_codon:yes stop_codon:yes gene_type:complete
MSGGKSGGGSGASGGGTSGRGARELKTRVKTAKGRRLSSTRWLERQLNDPYVQRAKREGYRGRAAFKLLEIDEKHPFLKTGACVVDLGCAPGGWLQVAAKKTNADGHKPNRPRGRILGIDLQEVDPLPGCELMQMDFLEEGADEAVKAALGGEADAVLSDMAAASSGHRATDHLRIMALCEAAAWFATEVLKPGGAFLAKTLQGGSEADLLAMLKANFSAVRHIKPPSSRKDSAEMYVLATGFRGRPEAGTGPEDPDAGPLG